MIWTPGRLIYYLIFETIRRTAKPVKLPVPVISVGNLSLGGTGKTPLVMHLARSIPGAAVLSRGYGSKGKGTREVFPDSDPRDVGDEPLLIKRKTDCPVFVGKDRAESGRVASGRGAKALILDDGFQYWGILKDAEIVILSARELSAGVHLLPWGKWREPLSALKRASIVILNYKLEPIPDDLPELGMKTAAMRYRPAIDLTGKRVFGFCGLGDNGSFRQTLSAAGAEVAGFIGFPDHHFYTRKEAERILRLARERDAIPATSSKDMVRVPPEFAGEMLEVEIKVELQPPSSLSFSL
ncbi:MAG: tetraacyldisaccharide 4'-kinase [candidate division WOR-3 bacterium]